MNGRYDRHTHRSASPGFTNTHQADSSVLVTARAPTAVGMVGTAG